jgi:hypothetical protein
MLPVSVVAVLGEIGDYGENRNYNSITIVSWHCLFRHAPRTRHCQSTSVPTDSCNNDKGKGLMRCVKAATDYAGKMDAYNLLYSLNVRQKRVLQTAISTLSEKVVKVMTRRD